MTTALRKESKMARFSTVVVILAVATTLMVAAPASASAKACWTCHYDSWQNYLYVQVTATCVYPASGEWGWGQYCYVFLDPGFFSDTQDCEFGGSECYYIVVTPHPATLRKHKASQTAGVLKPPGSGAGSVYLF
jgi:hypothetical protein